MAISHKAPFWFLFAAGGTIVAFVLPIMIFMTGIAPALGIFSDAWSYASMRSFVEGWFVKLVLFGIITLASWHAAHPCGSSPMISASAPTVRSPSWSMVWPRWRHFCA